MTPERWHQVKDILAGALELPHEKRSAFLDEHCGGDEQLRRDVELLLQHDSEISSDFLSQPVYADAAAALHLEEENPWVGRRVGAYQIVQQIAAGGMGEVYRAFRADDQYRKEVALKVIRAGQDSKFVVARFKNERQVLASLDHANIARLLDGGTTEDSLPYFVMELIEGEPLTEYCDSHKLTVTDRLKLFLQVCSAVQYAHQRLIIHRDLKPSNILVTRDGTPKLLDFGIAKILDQGSASPSTEPTISMYRLLTPLYASPEQIKGEPITTASDVYSLGVLLYELLSGHLPYRTEGRAPHEIAEAVCEFDPEKPSTVLWKKTKEDTSEGIGEITPVSVSAVRDGTPEKLSRRLRGDLDNITMMALRKEPQRRYVSVEQLAADLTRHLEDLPVSASRGTGRYRAHKFMIRHKTGVAAAAAITLTLLFGLLITLHEMRVARGERERAEQRLKDMRELARSNLFEFHDAIQNLPGSAQARHLVIQRALGYLDKLSHDGSADRALMDELASGYEKIAALQGNFSGPGIGDSGAALESYKKAFAIRESILANGDDVNELKAECDSLGGYERTLQTSGKTGEASRMAHHGIDIAQRLVAKEPNDPQAVFELARAHARLGWAMGGNGSSASTREVAEAIANDRESIRLTTQLAQANSDPTVLRGLLQFNLFLAYHLRKNQQYDESLKTYDSIWSMSKGLSGLPPAIHSLFFNHRSRLFDDMGNFRRAFEDESASYAVGQSMIQADPHDLIAQIYVAQALGLMGFDEARLGNKVEGKKKLDSAILVGEQLFADNRQEFFYVIQLMIAHTYQAEILSLMGNQEGARAKYAEALTMANDLARTDPEDMESRLDIAKIQVALGIVLARAKRYDDARQEISAGSSNLDELLKIRPHDPEMIQLSANSRADLSALQGCVAGRPCGPVSTFRPPILNN